MDQGGHRLAGPGACRSASGWPLAQKLGKSPGRTFVVMGDGECAEGSVWEAANAAAQLGLRNLVRHRRRQRPRPVRQRRCTSTTSRPTPASSGRSAGTPIVVDGHKTGRSSRRWPGRSEKGAPDGHPGPDDQGQGRLLHRGPERLARQAAQARGAREGARGDRADARCRRDALCPAAPAVQGGRRRSGRNAISRGRPTQDKTATRLAYGNALAALGKVEPAVVALDGDVKNSTYADKFFEAFPERSFQSYIAEQNMVGMGMGLAAKGFVPFIATFAAFLRGPTTRSGWPPIPCPTSSSAAPTSA